jgi:hypothetical protein
MINLKAAGGSSGPESGFKGKGIDIASLIGGPLIAASEANAMMLNKQADFILSTCFKEDPVTGNHAPIVVSISFKRSILVKDEDTDQPKLDTGEYTIEIPIITLIPLNTLGVSSVDVDFEMEIVNQYESSSTNSSPHTSSRPNSTVKTPKLYGKISYDSKEAESLKQANRNMNRQKLKVNIHAQEIPLPDGMKTLLQLYTKSIIPNDKTNSSNS